MDIDELGDAAPIIDTPDEIKAAIRAMHTMGVCIPAIDDMLRRLGKRVQDADKDRDEAQDFVKLLQKVNHDLVGTGPWTDVREIECRKESAIAALERVRGLVLDAGYEHYDVGSVGMMRIRGVIDAEIERVKGDHAP